MKKIEELPFGGQYDIYGVEETLFEKTIIYYHGGGLIYGTRSDLPNKLKQLFLEKGFTVVAMDYPLAPNSPLNEVIDHVRKNLDAFRKEKLKGRPFLLAGRSAGSFICFQLAKYLQEKQCILEGLINFYGYTDLDFVFQPNTRLNVSISPNALIKIELEQPIYDDPTLGRALLYFDAAHKGNLPELYEVTKQSAQEFSLSEESLQRLPKSFHTASTTDQEIPFSYSKRIKRLNSDASFVPVYDIEHDFLKLENEQVEKVYGKLADWLQQLDV